MIDVRSPLQGTVVSLEVAPGDVVRAGHRAVAHRVDEDAPRRRGAPSRARRRAARRRRHGRDARRPLWPARAGRRARRRRHAGRPQRRRRATGERCAADLAESIERHRVGLDEARPDAVARRRERGRRTARENVADLVDDGSFVEYGPLVIAAQRRRRDLDDLIANTPADGLVGGIGTVNGELFGPERVAVHRHVVRLHGPRRHPGPAEPPQEGPPVRARRAAAAADRVLHRGRRRPARRHRRHRAVRPRLPRLPLPRRAVRARPARRRQRRLLLRRQRRHPRLLRRRHRHRRTRTSAWAARR